MFFAGTPEDLPLSVLCAFCRKATSLHRRTLENIDDNPATKKSVDPDLVLVFACSQCKRVLSVKASLLGNAPVGLPPFPSYDTVPAGRHRCEMEGCKFRIQLYGLWSFDTTKEGRRSDAETWIWDNVTCPAGHSIQKPTWE